MVASATADGWKRDFFTAKSRHQGAAFLQRLELPDSWSKDCNPCRIQQKLRTFFEESSQI